jgi:glycerophosphoryl diester phosphodiesterase
VTSGLKAWRSPAVFSVAGEDPLADSRHTPGVRFAHPYLQGPGPLAFAHRGGAASGDENTLATFAHAVELGYRHLETDVHATADGVAVVFHDASTQRMLGHPGRLSDLTWKDLASMRVRGAGVVPRLDELLDAWPEQYVNIDMKSDGVVGPAVAVVARAGAFDRVLLASFRGDRIARARALGGPSLATSLGAGSAIGLWSASRTGFGGRRAVDGAVAAQMPIGRGRVRVVDRRFVHYAHSLGLAVHVWTVDDPGDMRGLLDAGVDGIMTDHIDVLRDVYAERGLWPA